IVDGDAAVGEEPREAERRDDRDGRRGRPAPEDVTRAPFDARGFARRAHDEMFAAEKRRAQIDARERRRPSRRKAQLRSDARGKRGRASGGRTDSVDLGGGVDLHVVTFRLREALVERAKRTSKRGKTEVVSLCRIVPQERACERAAER